MPITLEKLLSPTAEVSFEFMGETVNVTFAPMRYTGEMQDLALRLSDEETTEQAKIKALRAEAVEIVASANGNKEARKIAVARAAELNGDAETRERKLELRDRKAIRDFLGSLLVSWDVMEGRKPLPINRPTLDRLPDLFLKYVFVTIGQENQPDPLKAPHSDEP